MTEAFRDLRLHLAQTRQGDRPNRQGLRQGNHRQGNDRPLPITCFKCVEIGHKAIDCPSQGAPSRAQHIARNNYVEASHAESEYEVSASCKTPLYTFDNEYMPARQSARREAGVYATPFTPEQMRARARGLQDARGNSSGGQQDGVGPSRAPASRQPAAPSFPQSRRHSDLDIVGQLGITPAKLTMGTLLQEAPRCRRALMDFLLSIGGDQGPSSNQARQPRSAPRDPNGPVPMETTFETEVAYHAESSAPYHINSVLKGTMGVCGRAFDCTIDTGASDTVLSHTVVRKLGLMDKMAPSNSTFMTAAGKSECPMGMKWRVPITMGNLTLETDAMVTKANSYNVLIGNDWLQMAGADILLSAGIIRLSLDRDQYEDVPIEANTAGLPHVNTLDTSAPEGQKTKDLVEDEQYLAQFLADYGIDPRVWDNYVARKRRLNLNN